MKCWIIIPTYNGIKDIDECLATLQSMTNRDAYELIIVDDCSTDDTLSSARTAAPWAMFIRNERNSGFAASCNRGIEYAFKHGAQYVMLANQDLRFAPHWLDPLLAALEADENIAAIQPKIIMYPETDLINSCGNALHILGFGYTIGYLKKESDWPIKGIIDISYCSFAAVVLRASALRHVGLLDEMLFMYHEDSDLSWRLRRARYRTVLCSDARIYHRYEFSKSAAKFFYIERNRLAFMLKHYRLRTLFILLPLFLIWECGMLCYAAFGTLKKTDTPFPLSSKLATYASLCRSSFLKHITLSRRELRNKNALSDANLFRMSSVDILFQDVDHPLVSRFANPITRVYWRLVRRFI